MLEELLKSQAHVVLGAVLLWTVLGVVAGLLAAAAAYLVASKAGLLALDWPHAKWLRVLACVWLVVTFAVLGGMTGCAEGGLRGATAVVEESQFRTEVLRPGGRFAAVVMAGLDLVLARVAEGKDAELTEEHEAALDAFEKGAYEVDPDAFIARLEAAETALIRRVTPMLRKEVLARVGLGDSEMVNSLVEWALEIHLRKKLRERLGEDLQGAGIDPGSFFASLEESARKGGDPEKLSLEELSTHFEERIFIPMIVNPIRSVVRGQQTTLLVLAAAAWLIPVIGFWIGRLAMRKRAGATPGPSPPSTTPPPEAPRG